MCIEVVTQYVYRLLSFISQEETLRILNHRPSKQIPAEIFTRKKEKVQIRRSLMLYNRIRHTRKHNTRKKIHQQQSALVSSERLDGKEYSENSFFFARSFLLLNDTVSDVLNGCKRQKAHFFRAEHGFGSGRAENKSTEAGKQQIRDYVVCSGSLMLIGTSCRMLHPNKSSTALEFSTTCCQLCAITNAFQPA